MNSKLEERLYLYERDHPIHSDQDLLTALEAILDEQDSFPVEQRDFDLISEATEFALQLHGYNDEQLTEMANESGKRILDRIHERSIPSKKKTSKTQRSRLAWIILVAIVGALTITTVSGSIMGIDIPSATKELILSLRNHIVYEENDKSLIKSDTIVEYSSLNELSERYDDLNLLLPFNHQDSFTISDINSIDYGTRVVANIKVIVLASNEEVNIRITHTDQQSAQISPNYELSGLSVLLYENQGLTECYYSDVANSNAYVFQSESKQAISTILESLEEKDE